LDVLDEDVEESSILRIGCVLAQRVVLVLQQAVGGGDVDGRGCCVRVVVGARWGGVGLDLGEMVEEAAHRGPASAGFGFVFDAVLDCTCQ
jgi:hypothetical protein